MAAPRDLAGLLDRAGNVFSLAGKLGWAFQEEHRAQGLLVSSAGWKNHAAKFDDFYQAVLELRDAIQSPPAGLDEVIRQLREAATIAKGIRDSLRNNSGVDFPFYLDFFPQLNSVAYDGHQAVKAVTKSQRLDDPFAFLDQPTAVPPIAIDTTPTLPQPPERFVEAAGLDIPTIMGNINPKSGGAMECAAAFLAKQLNERGHTLTAAWWAIHAAVVAERLKARPDDHYQAFANVTAIVPPIAERLDLPKIDSGNASTGGTGPAANPPRYIVTATDRLWTWWRENEDAKPIEPPQSAHGEQVPEPKIDHPIRAAAAQIPASLDDSLLTLLNVFSNGLANERFQQAASVVKDATLSTHEKLTKIDAALRLPATASAESLGKMLGVSKQAVMKTEWWEQNRRGEKADEVGRRHHAQNERGKRYEPPASNSDEEGNDR